MRFTNEILTELQQETIANSLAIGKASICIEALKSTLYDDTDEDCGLNLLLILMGYISNKHKVYCVGDILEGIRFYDNDNGTIIPLGITHVAKQCYYLKEEYLKRSDLLSTIVNYDEYGFDNISEQINSTKTYISNEDFKTTSFLYQLLALGNIYGIFNVILTENFLSKKVNIDKAYTTGMTILAECKGNLFSINIITGELLYKNKRYKFDNWSNFNLEDSFSFITNCVGENVFLKASIGGYPGPSYSVKVSDNSVLYKTYSFNVGDSKELIRISDNTLNKFRDKLNDLDLSNWKEKYIPDEVIMDGTSWSIDLYLDTNYIKRSGTNSYPATFDNFCNAIKDLTNREFS